ncbi:MAG: hypothetical protein GY772_03970, partial [bacterium]|nr:hypothetical protein [bacterium]
MSSAGELHGLGLTHHPLGAVSQKRIRGDRFLQHALRGISIQESLPATGSQLLPLVLRHDLILMLLHQAVSFIRLHRELVVERIQRPGFRLPPRRGLLIDLTLLA